MLWFYALPAAAQALTLSAFTYLASAAGAATVFFSKKFDGRTLSFFVGLSAGIMIAACVFSLLLPAVEGAGKSLSSIFLAAAAFLTGGACVIAGDIILKRLNISDKKRGFYLLYGGVTFHNIPEGLSIGLAFAAADGAGAALSAALYSIGIGIQNFPEGVCLSYALKNRGLSAKRSFVLAHLSSLTEVAAAVIAALVAARIGAGMPYILAFSAGAMLAVVCGELIPEAFSAYKAIPSAGLIAGFAMMMLLDVAL